MKHSAVWKIAISTGLLAILFTKIELQEVISIFNNLESFYIALVILLTVLSIVWSAFKWKALLDARGQRFSLYQLTKVYFVGLFFNNFLPSSIGGDMMRIYHVGKNINSTSEAAASVILERLLATAGLALVSLLALAQSTETIKTLSTFIILFFVICILIMVIFTKPSLLRPLTKPQIVWWQVLINKLRDINKIIQSFKDKTGVVGAVILYSMLFQIIVVLINYYLLKAMHINFISLAQCMLFIPIISAISMIPLSINGLGVRESAYVLLFLPLGLSSSQAITLSMLFFTIVTLVSLIGGIFFVMERGKGEYIVSRSAAQ